jgi:hypothetical protein
LAAKVAKSKKVEKQKEKKCGLVCA